MTSLRVSGGGAVGTITALFCLLVIATPTAAATTGSCAPGKLDISSKEERLVAGDLCASVLLPDGYDGKGRYPVLYLLHGKDEWHEHWTEPTRGDLAEIARGFPGIVVMPDQRDGFSVDWYNGGSGGKPEWTRHWSEELIPAVEREFPIRPGRRWHAIAGVSMGGFGAMLLAAQRPDYFGSVAAFSAALNSQRDEMPLLLAAAGGNYEQMLGPVDGPYATGHNPIRTLMNLQHTRVLTRIGDGVPPDEIDDAGTFDPIGRAALLALGTPIELVLRPSNDEYAEAARQAGLDHDHAVRGGNHDYPSFRRHLREALAWDFFAPVEDDPVTWSFRTARAQGRAWHVEYTFGGRLAEVATFSYDRGLLRIEGQGVVTVRSPTCAFTAPLPVARHCPAGPGGAGRVALGP